MKAETQIGFTVLSDAGQVLIRVPNPMASSTANLQIYLLLSVFNLG